MPPTNTPASVDRLTFKTSPLTHVRTGEARQTYTKTADGEGVSRKSDRGTMTFGTCVKAAVRDPRKPFR